jgi:hypothetical protein
MEAVDVAHRRLMAAAARQRAAHEPAQRKVLLLSLRDRLHATEEPLKDSPHAECTNAEAVERLRADMHSAERRLGMLCVFARACGDLHSIHTQVSSTQDVNALNSHARRRAFAMLVADLQLGFAHLDAIDARLCDAYLEARLFGKSPDVTQLLASRADACSALGALAAATASGVAAAAELGVAHGTDATASLGCLAEVASRRSRAPAPAPTSADDAPRLRPVRAVLRALQATQEAQRRLNAGLGASTRGDER